jgi:integrase
MFVDMSGNSTPDGTALPTPRRRPVSGAPGIYYRPRSDGGGVAGPPYEYAYLDLTGHRRWRTVHGPLEQALREQGQHRHRRRRQTPSKYASHIVTFDQLAHDWLAQLQVRSATADRYQWALDRHLLPRLGNYPLTAIDTDLIGRLIIDLRRDNLAGWSVSAALQPLRIILNDAVRKGHIAANPINSLGRHELPNHQDQRPHRILSCDEIRNLLAAATTPRYRCLFELLLTSGLQIGEALGLTAADLDHDRNLIYVRQQLNRHKVRDQLKTPSSERVIDLPRKLLHKMHTLLDSWGAADDPDALIFTSKNRTGLERKVCRQALIRAAAAASLRPPHPTLHDLRHTHASMLVALDYPLADVQHRLGHAKPDTTLRVYTHQWRRRDAERSTIGEDLARLLSL